MQTKWGKLMLSYVDQTILVNGENDQDHFLLSWDQ